MTSDPKLPDVAVPAEISELFVLPTDLARAGSFIHVPAEVVRRMIKEIEDWIVDLDDALGQPGEQFYDDTKKSIMPSVEDLKTYMELLQQAIVQTGNETIKSGNEFSTAEEIGTELAGTANPDTLGGGGGDGGGRR